MIVSVEKDVRAIPASQVEKAWRGKIGASLQYIGFDGRAAFLAAEAIERRRSQLKHFKTSFASARAKATMHVLFLADS